MTKIREVRRSKGMSVDELAKRVGIVPTTLYRYETRKRTPTIFLAQAIAKVLGCTTDELFEEDENGKNGTDNT